MGTKNKQPAQPEKTPLEQRVEALVGPPPEELDTAADVNLPSAPPAEPEVAPSTPTTAPILPTEALPKEVIDPPPDTAKTVPATKPAATQPKAEAPLDAAPDVSDAEDQQTAAAVDDIVAKEADEVLAAEDAARAEVTEPEAPKRPQGHWLRRLLAAWWHNRWARNLTFAVVLLGVAAVAIMPVSRYAVLNIAGVRSRASLQVFDAGTDQPLKNVQVRLGGQIAKTDADGKASLSGVRLGKTQLSVERRAFAPITKTITVGWGSNPLGDLKLTATGSRYRFTVTDFLSGKPMDEATASAGEAEATADDKGVIVLTVDNAEDDGDLQVTIKAPTYRNEVLTINPDSKDARAVKMAPARKHVFVSKRSGKFDVYSIGVDGKDEKVLLKGTGNERDDITVAASSTTPYVAVVSTRDNVRNKEGFLLSTLNVINTDTGQVSSLGQSERMQVVDWVGDRLVYVQIAAGASANNPKRHRMVSYDTKSEDKQELASSNYFNDVLVADGAVYYAPSASFQQGSPGLFKVNADGTSRQTLLGKEVWNVLRTQYDRLSLAVDQSWYEYHLGDLQAGKVSGPPSNQTSRLYRDAPDKHHSLWVDNRDGKGVLLEYDAGNKKDTVLRTQSGLTNPVYWLSDKYVMYRIHTEQESADYVLNLEGGEPRKIRDVTNTAGVDRWYYY